VSGTYKQFRQDLAALGLPTQRQYESRSTFRNLALSAGASEFHVNLVTHPKPKRASDYYTRLEMQWPCMCEAVLAIDAGAWDGALACSRRDEVTVGVTERVTVEGTTKEEPPVPLREAGGELEREEGFDPGVITGFSRLHEPPDFHSQSSTKPADASGRIATERDAGDIQERASPLPAPSPELFMAGRAGAPRSAVEEILKRAVDQAAALRGGVA
jgi:hypothetical protein